MEMYSVAENYDYNIYANITFCKYKYNTNQNIIQFALYIIDDLHLDYGHFSYEYISKFITAGIVNCFVKLYNSPF